MLMPPKMRVPAQGGFRGGVFGHQEPGFLDVVTISVGSLDTSIVHPREGVQGRLSGVQARR